MLASRTRIFILILIATLVAVSISGGTYYLYLRATCALENYTGMCFSERVIGIIERHGVAAALTYLTDVTMPRVGYATTHLIMHSVGEMAYQEKGNVFETLAYLEPYEAYTSEPEFLGGFDGFVHGAVTSFFDDASDMRTPLERMQYVCESSEIKNITTNVHGCYHAIGHSFMYISGNKVDEAIRMCDEAATNAARDGCYYGVFMEQTFLFWPEYHPGIPRPDTDISSLIPICERFSGTKNRECERFVGQTYLTILLTERMDLGPSDMIDATKECDKLTENAWRCLRRLAGLFLPPYVQGTWSVEDVCGGAFPPQHQELCIDALRDGLDRGFGITERPRASLFERLRMLFQAAIS